MHTLTFMNWLEEKTNEMETKALDMSKEELIQDPNKYLHLKVSAMTIKMIREQVEKGTFDRTPEQIWEEIAMNKKKEVPKDSDWVNKLSIFKEVLSLKENTPVLGFEGELYFISQIAIEPSIDSHKFLVSAVTYSGLHIGAGFRNYILSADEINTLFTLHDKNMRELEQEHLEDIQKGKSKENEPLSDALLQEIVDNSNHKDIASVKELLNSGDIDIYESQDDYESDGFSLNNKYEYLILSNGYVVHFIG